jgi:hypothetical protein
LFRARASRGLYVRSRADENAGPRRRGDPVTIQKAEIVVRLDVEIVALQNLTVVDERVFEVAEPLITSSPAEIVVTDRHCHCARARGCRRRV